MTRLNLFNYSIEALVELFTACGEKGFRASQLIKWIYQLGVTDFAQMTNFSLALRKHLTEHYELVLPSLLTEQVAQDGTIKWLFELQDGGLIETVFIPEEQRGTLCVSSQVGCAVGCAFCATGASGFRRNLELAEIITQLWWAVRRLTTDPTGKNTAITNVVFMGMGEPLLNYEAVVAASQLMLSDHAYGLSKYRVTVSSCGIIPQLLRLKNDSKVSLAISLHAAEQSLRSKLVPINQKYPVKELIQICDHYYSDRKRRVTIEYIMLRGVNDSLVQAKQLAKLLAHGNYKINLIPANLVSHASFESSSLAQIDAFRQVLLEAGFNTITRKARGVEIMAACGQLAGSLAK